MLVTDQAKLIRMPLDSLRVLGRGTAGVRLFNVGDNEHVVGAAKIDESDDEADGAIDDTNEVASAVVEVSEGNEPV
jgi:DNA gyrase subunit A